MNTPAENPNDPWSTCSPGTIAGAKNKVHKQQGKTRRTALFQLAGICGVGVVATGTAMLVLVRPQNSSGSVTPAKISCHQVQQQLVAYVADTICDKKLKARITYHLELCHTCRIAFGDLRNSDDRDIAI